MQTLQKLLPNDKNLFYLSLVQIQDQIENLVSRFYHYFLDTEAAILFKDTDMEKQKKMFYVSLAFLIAHIDNPILLNEHLKLVVTKHKEYGVTSKHIPYFIDSFMSAIKETLGDDNERNVFVKKKKFFLFFFLINFICS